MENKGMIAEKKVEGLLLNSLADIYAVDVLTARLRKRRQAWLDETNRISVGRTRVATESWRKSAGDNTIIRRGKLFAAICERSPIAIFDDELIVGSQTEHVRGASPNADFSIMLCEEIVSGKRSVGRTEAQEIDIGSDIVNACKELVAFWKGQTPEEAIVRTVEKKFCIDWNSLVEPGLCHQRHAQAYVVFERDADYEKVLDKGLAEIIQEAEARISTLDFENEQDIEKWNSLQAFIIAMQGMITYAKRYSILASEMASREKDPRHRRELERIAATCEWVPARPARNFYEAVQSIRFIHLGLNLETAGSAETLGRLDQYLFPFYRRDIDAGSLTVKEAAEILGAFLLKLNEMENLRASFWGRTGASAQVIRVTLGGVDEDGNDATNELSYLLLHVVQGLKVRQDIDVRVSEVTPEEFLIKAVECNRALGGGIPTFFNDKRAIMNLVEDDHLPIEVARGYATWSCVHPYIPHASLQGWGHPYINGPKALELVMYNGWDPRLKRQVGMKTGDPSSFAGIDDWVEAWKNQIEYAYDLFHQIGKFAFHVAGRVYPLPFLSALTDDCIQKGQDIMQGGCRYQQFYMNSYSWTRANCGDALMAIKKLVYDERRLTVDQVLDACANDFDGQDKIRQMLLAAPKYGNDEDGPDELYRILSVWQSQLSQKHKNPFGYPAHEYRSGATQHFEDGRFVGALPDGRKAWTPVSDGGISPSQGTDRKGPTAVLRSAAKVVDVHANTMAVLNMKFSSTLLNGRENTLKFLNLIKTFFFDYLGSQIQVNLLDREVLLAAKANPQEYKDLIVRVGGYSAYFAELQPTLQDEIIARTEQDGL